MTGRYLNTALQFISVMILSRLLTPEEFGIYAVGLVFVNIAQTIRNAGIGVYIQQEKGLDKNKVGSALTISLGVGWSLGVVVWLCAPVLASYLQKPETAEVTRVVALNFFFFPLGCFAPALLKREMSFGTLLKIQLAQTFVGASSAVVFALLDFGYMSMAWSSVANTLTGVVLSQLNLPKKFRTFPKLQNLGNVVRFGKYVVGSNLLKELDAAILDTFTAKYLGVSQVGYLSRARGYQQIFTKTLEQGAAPVVEANLARQYRKDAELEDSFVTSYAYISCIGWLGLGYLALMSDNLIYVLYGDQWGAAAPYATALCFLGCFTLISRYVRSTMQFTGQVRTEFRTVLVVSVIRAALVVLLIGNGILSVLLGFALLHSLECIALFSILIRRFGFDAGNILHISIRNLAMTGSALSLACYYKFADLQIQEKAFINVLTTGLFAVIVWVTLAFLLSHPVSKEIKLVIKKAKKTLAKGSS